MGAAPLRSVWGSCRVCGTAVAPGASACGLCGADGPVAASAVASAPVSVRRRIAITGWLRTVIVIGVAVALAYALVTAVLAGPPNVSDPLTSAATYKVSPGSVAILSGDVTGGDYVVGNFTSVRPAGADVQLAAYNSTEIQSFRAGANATPVWSTPAEANGRIIFVAEYTDTYTFVVTNPYPAASNFTITVYIATTYESNVGDDGFG